MTMAEYIDREAVFTEIENEYKNVEKIKTPFAKIIVDGTVEKPYYSILWLDKENKGYNVGYSSYCLDYVFKWLEVVFEIVASDEYPSSDVAPVRHGRWIEHTKVIIPEPYNKWEQAWKCSECGFDDGFVAYNFCPNCGAKMDIPDTEEDDDGDQAN